MKFTHNVNDRPKTEACIDYITDDSPPVFLNSST